MGPFVPAKQSYPGQTKLSRPNKGVERSSHSRFAQSVFGSFKLSDGLNLGFRLA